MFCLLVLVLLLPVAYLISHLHFRLLCFCVLATQLRNRRFQLLNLDILDLCILLRSQFLHSFEQILLLLFDLDIIGLHILIFVLLQDFVEVLVQTIHLVVDLLSCREYLPP